MDPQTSMQAAQALGFTLPSPSYLFGALVFGLIGMVAFRLGRRQDRPRTVALAVALMLFPYLVSQTWMLWLVGAALCAGVWLDRHG